MFKSTESEWSLKAGKNEVNTALESSSLENIFHKKVDTVIDPAGEAPHKPNRARKSRMHSILAFSMNEDSERQTATYC